MWELMQAGKLEGGAATCTGRSMAENLAGCESHDREMIRRFADPLMERAGFLVLKGNLFDFAILKTSVISDAFRARYLRSEEHTSELQSLMRISYAVFCLKKKTIN